MGNVNTRSVETKSFYKINKLYQIIVSIWVSFKPDFSILEPCCVSRYGKGQGCLRHVPTEFWSLNRRQGGGTYMHRVQFLELFETSWFYRDRFQRPNLQKIRKIKRRKALCSKIGSLQASNIFKPFHTVRHSSTPKWQIQVWRALK